MSDDGSPYDDWEDDVNNALDASEIGEKPSAEDVFDFHDADQDEIDFFTDLWDRDVPLDLSESQYEWTAEMIAGWEGDWDDLADWLDADYWDWYRENYEGS